jgi:hypothetical protein
MTKVTKTPFNCSKFPWASERISPKIIDGLGTRSQQAYTGLVFTFSVLRSGFFLSSVTIIVSSETEWKFSPFVATVSLKIFAEVWMNYFRISGNSRIHQWGFAYFIIDCVNK